MNLHKYKNALGMPNKGIHSYRVFGLAIADVILTILGAGIISHFSKYNFFIVLILFFILGGFLHRIFSVRTTLDKLFFPNAKDF